MFQLHPGEKREIVLIQLHPRRVKGNPSDTFRSGREKGNPRGAVDKIVPNQVNTGKMAN